MATILSLDSSTVSLTPIASLVSTG
eukprot:COSAG02_NODE_26188_length_638_cov_1.794063_1_plen_24_part_01